MWTPSGRSRAGLVLGLAALASGCHDEPAAIEPAPPAPTVQRPAPAPTTPAEPTKIGEHAKRESGLVYETLKEGSGPQAKAGDTITVHCVAAVKDAEPFFSTRKSDHPVHFHLGDAAFIQGWNEGIVGMKVGELRKLTIPPNLAYGALGRLPVIAPNATLDVEIEALALGAPPAELKAEDLGRRFTVPSTADLNSGKNEWIEAKEAAKSGGRPPEPGNSKTEAGRGD